MQRFDLGRNAAQALLRSVLLDGFNNELDVIETPQPQQIGLDCSPVVLLDFIGARRNGWMRREFDAAASLLVETQIMEVTFQIGALVWNDPQASNYLELPTSFDICQKASYILQSQRGLNLLAAGGVRPLRVTDIRSVKWIDDSDRRERQPSFDITLTYKNRTETEQNHVVETNVIGTVRKVN